MARAPRIDRSPENKAIVVPEKMGLRDAAKWLIKQDDSENQWIRIYEPIEGHPLDAALALNKALMQVFGWVDLVATPNMFGSTPPSMITVSTGPRVEDSVQVPWGRMEIPSFQGGHLSTALTTGANGSPILVVTGEVMRRNESECMEVTRLARVFLREQSVFKGKAAKVSFDFDTDTTPDQMAPRFLDLSDVRPDELVFSETVYHEISVNLFTPITRSEDCRNAGIPLKRGVLLAGPYGTGKTLTAHVAAKLCVENGWTFLYLESVSDLDQAIHAAKELAPAMIFAEDIDQAMQGQNRNQQVNAILNSIDGIDTKGSEIIVALTTNHVDQISKAMLRPGRLDAVISVSPPDADAAIQLVRQYGRGLVDPTADLVEVGLSLAGQIPAVIREVTERSKLAAIHRSVTGSELIIQPEDLLASARSMISHLALLQPEPVDPRSDIEKAAAVLAEARPSLNGSGIASREEINDSLDLYFDTIS